MLELFLLINKKRRFSIYYDKTYIIITISYSLFSCFHANTAGRINYRKIQYGCKE